MPTDRRLKVFQYQTLAEDLLSGLPILDVGAWGFGFAGLLAARGHRVIAMDPHPGAIDYRIEGVELIRGALVGSTPGLRDFVMTENHEGAYVIDGTRGPSGVIVKIDAFTVEQVMASKGVALWDAVKTNCEGGEYDIFSHWPGPISRQIVINFHEHYRPRGEATIAAIVKHLSQWYVPIQHFKEKGLKYYAPEENYWDSLFCLKELA